MKQHLAIEINVPSNTKSLPDIHADGTYELLFRLPNDSYVRLLCENGDPVHEMYAKLVALETARRQESEAHASSRLVAG